VYLLGKNHSMLLRTGRQVRGSTPPSVRNVKTKYKTQAKKHTTSTPTAKGKNRSVTPGPIKKKEGLMYEVEAVLDARMGPYGPEYLVSWEGCPNSENMWIDQLPAFFRKDSVFFKKGQSPNKSKRDNKTKYENQKKRKNPSESDDAYKFVASDSSSEDDGSENPSDEDDESESHSDDEDEGMENDSGEGMENDSDDDTPLVTKSTSKRPKNKPVHNNVPKSLYGPCPGFFGHNVVYPAQDTGKRRVAYYPVFY
jgi:hypothetical protein